MKHRINQYLPVAMVLLVVAVMLSGCAPRGWSQDEYGFFSGIWHGLVVGFAITARIVGWVLHLLNDNWGNWDIGLWADNNSGFGYIMGYLLGLSLEGKVFSGAIRN